MAKKTSFSNVPEPKKLGYWATKRIQRQGRKDARKTQSVKDFSRTQAVNSYESVSQRGEMDLNDWLLRVTSPYIAGNARIEAEALLLVSKIKKAKAVTATTGRQKKNAAQRLAALEQEMADLRAQYAANRETGWGQIRRAEESKPLWENYFNLKVSIYNRARAAKLKQSVDAVTAEIPVYRAHDLVELEQFDREFPVKDGDF